MTNATNDKTNMTTTTLDKWWSQTTEEEGDVLMEDKQEKEREATMDNKGKTPKYWTKQNKPTHNVTERFPMTLRFKINSDSKENAHKKHQEVLRALAVNVKHCEIYSTNGDKTTLKTKNHDEFFYHETKNKRNTHYTVVHRVVLDVKYHAIKQQQAILDALHKHKCQLQMHEWHTNEWDIISVGFISGSSPKHQAKDTLYHKLTTTDKKAPKFNLHATNLKLETENQQYRTLAYEIHCLRENYNEVCEYVATACKVLNQTFIKYKWKHSDRNTYDNGIKKQIAFTNSIRTIPLYGIHPIAMEFLYKDLIEDNDIIDINSTGKTSSHGRWNIYVTLDNFESQTRWFQSNIEKLYHDKCNTVLNEIPTDYKPVIQFNSTIVFQDKQEDPLLKDASESVSSFSNTSVSGNSWASVVANSKTKSYQTISTITSTNDMMTQLAQMNESIKKICDRLDNIEQRLNDHEDQIQQMQEATTINATLMERLPELIEKLERRTADINPRRLELTFDQPKSNKRRNINSTPTKDRNRE